MAGYWLRNNSYCRAIRWPHCCCCCQEQLATYIQGYMLKLAAGAAGYRRSNGTNAIHIGLVQHCLLPEVLSFRHFVNAKRPSAVAQAVDTKEKLTELVVHSQLAAGKSFMSAECAEPIQTIFSST
ncbi:hypothetical protein NPIL_465611 [Nephila pilipes]|uniref:Uncharacterized protein n=1 Tax=Nephila pilipes TaxID=299642 RepID=A0A8X6NDM7_NEPPI|nr:hypothetical protein NPIL_255451 [Nephila pilipes]GFT46030.1 hypothetical protein NPIL_465611 [Nephila pilipes]